MADAVVGELTESRPVRVDDADLIGGLHFVDLAREDDLPGQLIGRRRRWNCILGDGSKCGSCEIKIRGCDLLGDGGRGKVGGRGRLKRGEQIRRRG